MPARTPPDPDLPRRVGANIRRYRVASGLRQRDVAAALNVSVQQVQKFECGINAPKAGQLYRIARRIGVSVDALYAELPPAQPDGTRLARFMQAVRLLPIEQQMVLAQTVRLLADGAR